MNLELKDKVVIVTGVGSGIGQAAAWACAAAGAVVVGADYDTKSGNETVTEIERNGGEGVFVQTDVSKEDEVAALVAAAVARYGRLDGAFNNAGLSQNNVPLHELTIDQWRRIQGVNYDGVFFCMKYEIRAMLGSGGGSIVNTSSGLGRVAVPMAAEYCGSKGGVLGLTKGAAVDYGEKGIRVNAVLPGVIRTPMIEALTSNPHFAHLLPALEARHPIGRLGLPSEVADAVVWLLSDKSSFVTGAEIPVDGGYLAV